MKIHLTLNDRVIPATLADNTTAREFAAMLPLTITMHDLFKREKFGPLPCAISGTGTRTQAYEVGDIVCWAPGPDVAIFYRHDGQTVSGGIHVLGKLDAGADAEAFAVPGPVQVHVVLACGSAERVQLRVLPTSRMPGINSAASSGRSSA
jgi:hypothetical protein